MVDSTILFPNYNNEHVLPLTFRYLRENVDCSRFSLVMVDDGSEDDSLRVAREEISRCGFASAQLIERPHAGIVSALNAGLEATKTEFVLRIDGDATVETPGWADRLTAWLRRYPEVGVVGGQVIFDHGGTHSFGRSLLGEYGLHDMGTCPLEPAGRRTFDSFVYRPPSGFLDTPPYEVDTILGVCVAFRLEDAASLGGFDSRFEPVWIEDDDFGFAVRAKLGKRVIVDPKIRVTHRIGLRGSREPGRVAAAGMGNAPPLRVRVRRVMRATVPSRARRAARLLVTGRSEPAALPVGTVTLPTENNEWRKRILLGHYDTWHSKWGFHPLNPDPAAVLQRYFDTGAGWKINPARHALSRAFLAGVPGEL
jgi:GT2 family glycosyltransferase